MAMAGPRPCVLWWGRHDPDYSRNRILRGLLRDMGWRIKDFHPRFSGLADWEARLRLLPRPDLVWVPCFRQRDLAAASRWARAQQVPLLFDPLISAYDKQVDERGKWPADSPSARRLLAKEQGLFQRADIVLADTPSHADYFSEVLGVVQDRLHVVYVGAEEALFKPAPPEARLPGAPMEVLFFGSFIPLQGPEVIVEAARIYQGPPVRWVLLGDGPLRPECERRAQGVSQVVFKGWLPYTELPGRIQQADLLLGVFGATPKAGRVIPNKVFQGLACGRPVVTRRSDAYPAGMATATAGISWVPAGDAEALARTVAMHAARREALAAEGQAARALYDAFLGNPVVRDQLSQAMQVLHPRAPA